MALHGGDRPTSMPTAGGSPMAWLPTCLGMAWASPNSLLGLAVALSNRPFRGRLKLRWPTLEAHGPLIAWLFDRTRLLGNRPSAMTLGHVILARSACELERCRAHERVHVRQYARWGPFFLPAYFLASYLAWRRGEDAYYDNFFEREAYAEEPAS